MATGVNNDGQWSDHQKLFSDADRRRLLERLERPDYANLVSLVARDLDAVVDRRKSGGFGSHGIHRKLMLDQLEALLLLKPKLINDYAFVEAYVKRLVPSDGLGSTGWRDDPAKLRSYLNNLEGFVGRLGKVHDSLKSHVFYHKLLLDRSEGVFNKKLFMRYLAIPRIAYYSNMNIQTKSGRRSKGQLGQKIQQLQQSTRFRSYRHPSELTNLSGIDSGSKIVESYLQHFFITETETTQYGEYLDKKFVNRQLAYTKILNQDVNAKRWYDLLTPSEIKNLKNRVDINFTPQNQKYFSVADDVKINVAIKNVKDLIVNVYQINTINYYQKHKQEIDTAINLEGLVANDKYVYRYADKPMSREVRQFKFDKITEAGVYVIDFIGNGKSSRVVLRKGMLRFFNEAYIFWDDGEGI